MNDNKPLSEAQKRHLIALNDAVIHAQAALNEFVVYLRDEHQAPPPEWTIRDATKGFERLEKNE